MIAAALALQHFGFWLPLTVALCILAVSLIRHNRSRSDA